MSYNSDLAAMKLIEKKTRAMRMHTIATQYAAPPLHSQLHHP